VSSFSAEVPFGLSVISSVVGNPMGTAAASIYADPDDGQSAEPVRETITTRWLYSVNEPERLTPFRSMNDLLKVAKPEELRQLLPVLRIAGQLVALQSGLSAVQGGSAFNSAMPAFVGGGGGGWEAAASGLREGAAGGMGAAWQGIEQLESVISPTTADGAQQGLHVGAEGPSPDGGFTGSGINLMEASETTLRHHIADAAIAFGRDFIGAERWEQLLPTFSSALNYATAAEAAVRGQAEAAATAAGGQVGRGVGVSGVSPAVSEGEPPMGQPGGPGLLSAKALQGRLDSMAHRISVRPKCMHAHSQFVHEIQYHAYAKIQSAAPQLVV
jgi:hypothetical protein